MRYTLAPRMHLSRLPLPTRVLLTSFLVTLLAALAVGGLKYSDRAEFSPTGARTFWHGDAAAAEPAGGDGLLPGESELEERPAAPPAAPRKSLRYLVDVVHPHLFTVPIVLFIVLHLLVLTRLSDRWKIALTLHAFGSTAATFGLPFLVAATGAGAGAFLVAGASLMLSFVALAAILLIELWRAPPTAAGERSDA